LIASKSSFFFVHLTALLINSRYRLRYAKQRTSQTSSDCGLLKYESIV
jgi:hypothetical protein